MRLGLLTSYFGTNPGPTDGSTQNLGLTSVVYIVQMYGKCSRIEYRSTSFCIQLLSLEKSSIGGHSEGAKIVCGVCVYYTCILYC